MSIPVVPGASPGPVGSPQRNVGTTKSVLSGASPSSPRVVSQPQEQKIVQDILDCIRDMKADFEDGQIPINDDSQQLQRFCAKLEYLLQCNMKEKKNLLGRRKDYWDYFCDCLGSTKGISDGIRFVKSLGEYKTSIGKGRAFLRFCLMHNRMADSLQACIINGKTTSDWYYTQSLWLQQDRNSVLINALYDLSELQFDLAPRGYDLDNAWPSFARKNLGSVYNWNVSRSRTSSMSSLISIPGQEISPQKLGLSTTPSDMGDVDHFNQELSISESLRSDLTDKIEALEQQKSVFQHSVAHTQGELDVMKQQLHDFKSQNQQLVKDYGELKQKYDKLVVVQESKLKDWERKENEHAHKKEEVEKLFEQVISLEDKIQRQGETIYDYERQKTDLQFEVKTLYQKIDSEKESISKKEEEMATLREKLKRQEEKNEELLSKVENMLMDKNSEANSQMDSVSKLEETLLVLKQVELENLRLNSQNDDLIKKCESLQSDLDEKNSSLNKTVVENQDNMKEKQNLLFEVEKLSAKDGENVEKICRLESELKELNTKLSESESSREAENASLNQEINNLKSDVKKIDDNLKNKIRDFEDLKSQEEKLENERVEMSENLDKLQNEFELMKLEGQKESDIHKENCTKLQNIILEKEKCIELKEKELQEKENVKSLLQEDLTNNKRQLEKMRENISELENKNHSLESQRLTLDKELSSLRECQEIEKGSSVEIKGKLEEKMELVKKLEVQIAEVKVLLKLISEEKVSESTEIPEALCNSGVGNLLQSMISKCMSDVKSREDLSELNGRLTKETDLLKQEIAEKGRQLHDLEISFGSLHSAKADLENELCEKEKSLQASLKQMEGENSTKDKKILDLSEKQKDLENKTINMEKITTEQSEKLKIASESYDTLGNKCKTLENKLMASVETGDKLRAENMKLQETIVTKETEVAELREKSVKTEAVLQQKSERIENESNLSVKLQTQVKDYEKSVQQLKEKLSELTSVIDGNKKSEDEHKLKNNKLEMSNKDLLGQISKLQECLKTKDEELKKESENLGASSKENISLEKKLKDSKEKQFDLEQKLNSLKKQHENSVKEDQQVLNKLETERHKLKQHLEDAIKDIESIKQQLTQTSTELSIAYSEKDKLESEKNDLVIRQTDLLTEIDKVNKENRSFTIDIENIQEKASDFSEKCLDLEDRLKNSDLENDTLKKEIVDLKNEIEKLTSHKLDFETKQGHSQDELKRLTECVQQLELKNQTSVDEKTNLNSRISELSSELSLKSEHIQEVQFSKDSVEKELSDLKISIEESKQTADLELEKLKAEHEQEVEVLKQEVTSLQFQLSSEQLKYEQTVESYTQQDTSITEMTDRLSEQETLIEQLEHEMSEIKSSRQQEKTLHEQELEELRKYISCLDEEKKELNSKLQQISKELETEKLSVVSLQTRLKEEECKKGELSKQKEKEVTDLKSDTQQLKKKLIKLIKEKDSLWQKTDQLAYQQKMAAKDKWLDEKNVTHCMLCQTEFTFTVRKHHCRFCGRVFCSQCSDNWIQTTHSSKKSRACKTCYTRNKELEEEDGQLKSNNSEDDLEETVEIPKMHKPRGVMNESTSSTLSASSAQDDLCQTSDGTAVKETGHMTIPGQVASAMTVSMVDGNLPDEIKEKQKDENFHVISDEEVSKSVTESEYSFQTSDPNMIASMTISTSDLEKGQVNSQNDISVKPGKTFAVPVLVDHFNTTLCWEFHSYPKDVVFGVHYQTMTGSNSEVLIPPCKVDSHKQSVKGELTAKQLGIYSLIFDNTYSRLTSKKVTYRLWSKKP